MASFLSIILTFPGSAIISSHILRFFILLSLFYLLKNPFPKIKSHFIATHEFLRFRIYILLLTGYNFPKRKFSSGKRVQEVLTYYERTGKSLFH